MHILRNVTGGGNTPTLLRFERWRYKASEVAKRNILISPLEGEKKFLGELCELRNFREGYKKYKNSDRATKCAIVCVGDKKGKIKMNKNNLRQKQPNNPVVFPETNYSQFTTHHSPKQKSAFTLAEVLITLGIIGVVAAITMPVLISNVQDRVKQKRVENIKQKLSKVTDKMAVQSGLIGYGDTMAFVNEMTKHMKVAKVCDNNHIANCWPTKEVNLKDKGKTWDIAKTKNAKTLKINKEIRDNWADTVGIVTADGTAMILSYDKTCDFDVDKTGLVFNNDSAMSNSMGCLSGVFDWNGGKNPNKLGEDILTIGLASGLGTDCAFELGGKCFTAPKPVEKPLTKAECEAEKDKLGIKECYYNQDYWAGAVFTCKGTDKMMTASELRELAALLYNNKNIISSPFTPNHLRMDVSLAVSMGFSSKDFGMWTGEEYNSEYATYRYFSYATTDPSIYGNRKNQRYLVVCSGD